MQRAAAIRANRRLIVHAGADSFPGRDGAEFMPLTVAMQAVAIV